MRDLKQKIWQAPSGINILGLESREVESVCKLPCHNPCRRAVQITVASGGKAALLRMGFVPEDQFIRGNENCGKSDNFLATLSFLPPVKQHHGAITFLTLCETYNNLYETFEITTKTLHLFCLLLSSITHSLSTSGKCKVIRQSFEKPDFSSFISLNIKINHLYTILHNGLHFHNA